jgi:hypothetical protein
MTAVEPVTSGLPSRSVTFPEYFVFASSKNSFQLVGASLTRSLR